MTTLHLPQVPQSAGSSQQFDWIDALPDPALIIDAGENRLLAANRALCRMLGRSLQALKSTPCTELFPGKRPELVTFTEETLFRSKGWSRDLSLLHRDGHKIEVEITSARLGPEESRTLLMLLRDCRQLRTLRGRHEANSYHRGGILEWRRVNELFSELEQHNHLILHAVGEGIYGVDAEGRATFINPAAERMLGWHSDELMGRVMHRVVHHSHANGSLFPLNKCPIYAAFRDSTVHRVEEDLFWHKDGHHFPVEYTSTPILDNGHPIGAVVVFRDISARLKAQQELREALQEVESLKHRLEMENAYLQEELSAGYQFHEIVGTSEAIKGVIRRIAQVAPTDANVLITGESGTGKELIARAIHQASQRRDRPMIRVNCAAIPKDLFESEFFGHVKGAFSGAISDRIGRFELAHGGTLFLDEVGEIPLELQGKLLRVLQEHQFERVGENRTRAVDVRVIAATNRDLGQEVTARNFRQDLYFRLNVFPIESVPLRERIEDIPLLAQEFLNRACMKFNRPARKLTQLDISALKNYSWPGNVRELENIIERQVITSDQVLDFKLPDTDTGCSPSPRSTAPAAPLRHFREGILTEQQLRDLEKQNLMLALRMTEGRVFGEDGAAALLGVPPTTLSSRIKKLRLNPQDYRRPE